MYRARVGNESLLFGLGEFNEQQLPPSERGDLIQRLLSDLEQDPDARVHATMLLPNRRLTF